MAAPRAGGGKGDDVGLDPLAVRQRRGTGDDAGFSGFHRRVGQETRGGHVVGRVGIARQQRRDARGFVVVEPVVGKGGEVEQPLGLVGRRLDLPTAAPDFPVSRTGRARASSPFSPHNGTLLFRRFYAELAGAIPATYWFSDSLAITLEMHAKL